MCLLKSQLGISETELKDLISEREKKVEELQESLKEIQVSSTKVHDTQGRTLLLTGRKRGKFP